MSTRRSSFACVVLTLLTVLVAAIGWNAPQADEKPPGSIQKHRHTASGPLAYAISSDGVVAQFGLLGVGSGVFTMIADLPNPGQGLARDTHGRVYTVDTDNNLVRIKPANGKTKVVGSTGVTTPGPLGSTLVDVFASLASGELFLMDYSNNLYSVNAKTGVATLIGATGIPPIISPLYSSSLAGNCQELFFTISEVDENPEVILPPTLYRIDPGTAAATMVGPTANLMTGSGFVANVLYGFTPDQRFFGGTEGPHALSIDVATGATTTVSDLTVPFVFGAVSLGRRRGRAPDEDVPDDG